MMRVIDNKRVEMTQDEFNEYQRICKSYDRPHFKGEDLFKDLFETNSKGIIVFLRAPVSYISFECYFFIVNLFVHQHLSQAASEIHELHQTTQDNHRKSEEILSRLEKLEAAQTNK